MRQLIVILIITWGLSSCEKTPDNSGYEQCMIFFKEHADNFLKSELLKYNYNPRTQYSLLIKDTLVYRALLKKKNNELIGVFGDMGFRTFMREFKIPIDTNLNWGRLYLKADSTHYIFELESYDHPDKVINLDTLKGDVKTEGNYSIPENLMGNPIQYFAELDKERENYGIVDFRRLRIGKIIEVNFSDTDYLLYFPPDREIGEKKFQEYWDKKIKEGKKLGDNWYYYKREKPLDNG